MTTRRRLVRPTGPLADRKREEDELATLIAAASPLIPTVRTAQLVAAAVLDAGYTRRVVVDDTMVKRALDAWTGPTYNFADSMRAALTAALDRTDR